MSSITRAVTSRLSEFTNGRQRLTSEKQSVTPGQFNYIIPPEIIWEDYQAQKQEPLKVDVGSETKIEIPEKKTSPSIFSQKMSAVVRKLSPFSDDSSSSSSKEKDNGSTGVAGEEEKSAKKSGGRFKETKQKMERFKKLRRSKDRQQLIESSDDEC
ncbi:hypothetical protein GCK72_023171 [Caenorhabditis remanei]|uniref:Uncharacterized protein n=2 Tax=Caenorhabditis TaxID=6237 RepID=E3MKD1_CAERE|nr:hypothetical protein GCK72_023171 [Caenorhabditis remanei]EFP04071.1 hypothetical protein CRE_27586 [Caenorhabditis remanei]KAF1746714.1 hypothetical protein GCK72_023171 [Caenorhabditis remanei]